jgi:hypothetical protein
MNEDMFITDTCHNCGEEYTADLACAPKYCALYCSKGCADQGGWPEENL